MTSIMNLVNLLHTKIKPKDFLWPSPRSFIWKEKGHNIRLIMRPQSEFGIFKKKHAEAIRDFLEKLLETEESLRSFISLKWQTTKIVRT